jgi:hypothetical protein
MTSIPVSFSPGTPRFAGVFFCSVWTTVHARSRRTARLNVRPRASRRGLAEVCGPAGAMYKKGHAKGVAWAMVQSAVQKRSGRRDSNSRPSPWQGDALPLSHFRPSWCRSPESNWGHRDFQSRALPTELPRLTHPRLFYTIFAILSSRNGFLYKTLVRKVGGKQRC